MSLTFSTPTGDEVPKPEDKVYAMQLARAGASVSIHSVDASISWAKVMYKEKLCWLSLGAALRNQLINFGRKHELKGVVISFRESKNCRPWIVFSVSRPT